MLEFKIVPQFRNNCVIQGKKEILDIYQEGDTIFVLLNTPSKSFSVITKIEGIAHADENVIYIDQRILGGLAESDMVTILKHNPAEALAVYIAISQDFTLVGTGDWTPVIKKHVENRVFDFGQEISFVIPWEEEDGKQLPPIPVSGMVYNTIPPPPVKTGLQTKIFLNKFSEHKILQLKQDNLDKQKGRVKILEEQRKHDTLHLIQTIKQNNYPYKANKYAFENTNPKQLLAAIMEVFKGFRIVEAPAEKTFDSDNQTYLGSVVFLSEEIADSLAIIDVQVLANNQNGELIVTVTAKNDSLLFDLQQKYDMLIRKIKIGLEQKTELIIEICPNCGAKLPLENVKQDGSVECEYCYTTTLLPKTFRY